MTIIIMMFSHLHFDWRVKRLVMPSAQSYHHRRHRRHRPFICECSKNARGRVGGAVDENALQHVFEAFLPLSKSENRSFCALI